MQLQLIVRHVFAAALLAVTMPLDAGVVIQCRVSASKLVPRDHCASDQAFLDAVRLFREQRWSFAYGRYIAMAQEGDADAARIALFMHRYGPVLFDTHWDASADELEDWASLARTEKGRPAPGYTPARRGRSQDVAPRVKPNRKWRVDGKRA